MFLERGMTPKESTVFGFGKIIRADAPVGSFADVPGSFADLVALQCPTKQMPQQVAAPIHSVGRARQSQLKEPTAPPRGRVLETHPPENAVASASRAPTQGQGKEDYLQRMRAGAEEERQKRAHLERERLTKELYADEFRQRLKESRVCNITLGDLSCFDVGEAPGSPFCFQVLQRNLVGGEDLTRLIQLEMNAGHRVKDVLHVLKQLNPGKDHHLFSMREYVLLPPEETLQSVGLRESSRVYAIHQ